MHRHIHVMYTWLVLFPSTNGLNVAGQKVSVKWLFIVNEQCFGKKTCCLKFCLNLHLMQKKCLLSSSLQYYQLRAQQCWISFSVGVVSPVNVWGWGSWASEQSFCTKLCTYVCVHTHAQTEPIVSAGGLQGLQISCCLSCSEKHQCHTDTYIKTECNKVK